MRKLNLARFKLFFRRTVNKIKRNWLKLALVFLLGLSLLYLLWSQLSLKQFKVKNSLLQNNLLESKLQLSETSQSLVTLQNTDQIQRNKELETEIRQIQSTFSTTVTQYESIIKLSDLADERLKLNQGLSKVLVLLSKRNYSSASAELTSLKTDIQAENDRLAALTPKLAANLTHSNAAPGSGSSRQVVDTEVGSFQVDIIAADLNSTKVVVETASSGDCTDNCPVSSLADYLSRAGGFAGVNGPYFCPAEYPSCAGKTNSFDTLLMNRQKVYFNSGNNVYSTVPAVIFSGSSARFVGQSLEWGRDTGPDSVIASQPLLLSGGEIRFGGDDDPKKGSRGSRSFIGTKGNTVYIGVVRSATVAEVAWVLRALGLENAINLDSGGSTALMFGGKYLAGPGRNTPFGIVLVNR